MVWEKVRAQKSRLRLIVYSQISSDQFVPQSKSQELKEEMIPLFLLVRLFSNSITYYFFPLETHANEHVTSLLKGYLRKRRVTTLEESPNPNLFLAVTRISYM